MCSVTLDTSVEEGTSMANRRTEYRSPWANRPSFEEVPDFTVQSLDNEYSLMLLLLSPLTVIITWLRKNGFIANEVR